jgi:RNA ligase (TIGR02306 family)
MSEWKVSVEAIEIFDHPNADRMQIGKVGTYQVVVQKNLYKTGDIVAFAPEKSILPQSLKEPWEKYLTGTNKDRVKGVRLRGEFSCGIIIPLTTVQEKLGYVPEVGVDISEKLSIRKFEPPVPVALMGSVQKFPEFINNTLAGAHDCEHFRTYVNEFVAGERVIVQEKLHGSQLICTADAGGNNPTITSKGLRKDDLCIKESEANSYWQAFHNCKLQDVLFEAALTHSPTKVIRVFGELVPCQKGYAYGLTKPEVRIFDIRVDGQSIPYDQAPPSAKKIWVPLLYDGPFEEVKILPLCEGNEQVSGKEYHIREGCVVSPYIDRYAKDRTRLRLKVINPKYKDEDDAFN